MDKFDDANQLLNQTNYSTLQGAIVRTGGGRKQFTGTKVDNEPLRAAQVAANIKLGDYGRQKLVGQIGKTRTVKPYKDTSTLTSDTVAASFKKAMETIASAADQVAKNGGRGTGLSFEYDPRGYLRLSQAAVQTLSQNPTLTTWLNKRGQKLSDLSGKGRLVTQKLLAQIVKATGKGNLSYYPMLQYLIGYNYLLRAAKGLDQVSREGAVSFIARKRINSLVRAAAAPVQKVQGLIKRLKLDKGKLTTQQLYQAQQDSIAASQQKMQQFITGVQNRQVKTAEFIQTLVGQGGQQPSAQQIPTDKYQRRDLLVKDVSDLYRNNIPYDINTITALINKYGFTKEDIADADSQTGVSWPPQNYGQAGTIVGAL